MADTDTALPLGIELTVKLDIGDGAIVGELGTVTLEPGDTADKVIAEFLIKVAEAVNAQTKMALDMIDAGLMTRVEVPRGELPDPRYMPGTQVVRGTPEALALLLGNAQDVNDATPGEAGCCGGACKA